MGPGPTWVNHEPRGWASGTAEGGVPGGRVEGLQQWVGMRPSLQACRVLGARRGQMRGCGVVAGGLDDSPWEGGRHCATYLLGVHTHGRQSGGAPGARIP